MVHSRDALKIIAGTLQRRTEFPDEMSYILSEPDPDGRDAEVSVPVIALQDTDTTRDDPSNSNFVDYIRNDAGERVGRRYQTSWEMSLQIDIWTAAGSDNNVDEFGDSLYSVLYRYDTRGPGQSFKNEDGELINSIYDFALRDGSRNDSLDQTPSVRRWRQEARVRGVSEFTTLPDNPPVRDVTQNRKIKNVTHTNE